MATDCPRNPLDTLVTARGARDAASECSTPSPASFNSGSISVWKSGIATAILRRGASIRLSHNAGGQRGEPGDGAPRLRPDYESCGGNGYSSSFSRFSSSLSILFSCSTGNTLLGSLSILSRSDVRNSIIRARYSSGNRSASRRSISCRPSVR